MEDEPMRPYPKSKQQFNVKRKDIWCVSVNLTFSHVNHIWWVGDTTVSERSQSELTLKPLGKH